MLVVATDAKLGAFTYVVRFRPGVGFPVMDANIEQMDAALVFAVIPTYIRGRPVGLDNDSDTMQLGVAWMENVTGHP